MPIPFSDEVDEHPEVGIRPATWHDGTPITETLWEHAKTADRAIYTNGKIGTRPGNKSDTIWGVLSADDGQGGPRKALIVGNTGEIANIQRYKGYKSNFFL